MSYGSSGKAREELVRRHRLVVQMERSATAAADLMTIELGFVEDDDPELDVWAARVRGDLLDAGVESVQSARTAAPEGSRAVDGLIAGLIVQVAPAAVGVVVEAIKALLGRSSRRVSIRIGDDELVIDGATTESQEQLVAAFLSRHSVSRPAAST
jgi:hypothetical protein